ncbi:MAG: cas6e [Chthonomonadales bacterium]|nr:cas6e [Chthonomonadales bacterium]
MFLSKVILNPRHRMIYRLASDLYAQHRFVMSAFPDLRETDRESEGGQDQQGVLYRLEADREFDGMFFLVQSRSEADWAKTREMHPDVLCSAQSKTDSRLFEAGERYRFRLRANPTVCRVNRDANGNRQASNRVGLYKEEEQRDWLARTGERFGFRVIPEAVLVTSLGKREGFKPTLDGSRPRHPVTCYMVDFDSTLLITDAPLFSAAVRDGVGRGKAWGCGLLSLMRA